ncbi:MAG: hypothetical protein RLZZ303_1073 [Candidatus Hydrogenedentota bacterium]|jgi:TRAP transporter TAXI family solute receptor
MRYIAGARAATAAHDIQDSLLRAEDSRMPYLKISFFVTLGAALLGGCGPSTEAPIRFVSIGTGGQTGVYYPVGGALATLINEGVHEHGLKASVETTGGSVFNINALLVGDISFGIAQADRAYQARSGHGEWAELGPQEKLMAVCALYTEMVTCVAAEDTGAREIAGLKGKVVSIGNAGSGQRMNAIDVFTAAGIDWQQDITPESIRSADCPKMLHDDRIDAYFFTVGHPTAQMQEVSVGRRKVRILPITGMDALIEQQPFYTKASIPLEHYTGMANEEEYVETIGVTTLLLTSSEAEDETVRRFARALYENLELFRQQHPALAGLDPKFMIQTGIVPIHPGAETYYREIGLL